MQLNGKAFDGRDGVHEFLPSQQTLNAGVVQGRLRLMRHRTGCNGLAILAVVAATGMLSTTGCSHGGSGRTATPAAKTNGSEAIGDRQDQTKGASETAKGQAYAAYFKSLSDQVRNHWSPANVYRQHDPDGTIYGEQDRYTLLEVLLGEDGWLRDVWVVHSCGLEWLDEVALEAFWKAQPFEPPPRKLLRPSRMAKFGLGFFFETKRSTAASSTDSRVVPTPTGP